MLWQLPSKPTGCQMCLSGFFVHLVPSVWSLLQMWIFLHSPDPEYLILISCVSSQFTGWLELKIMFLELLPQIYHCCSKLSREKFWLSAEENFHHERANHLTFYDIQKQFVYHIEDISLMFLVLIVSKILYYFHFSTAYNTGYSLSLHRALFFLHLIWLHHGNALSGKGESFLGKKGCHYFGDVQLLHADDNASKYGNLHTFSGLRCSMFLKNKPVFSRLTWH